MDFVLEKSKENTWRKDSEYRWCKGKQVSIRVTIKIFICFCNLWCSSADSCTCISAHLKLTHEEKKKKMQFDFSLNNVNRKLCNISQEKCLISTDNIKHLKRSPDKVNINDLIRTASMSMGKDIGMFHNYLGKTTAFWESVSKSLVKVR